MEHSRGKEIQICEMLLALKFSVRYSEDSDDNQKRKAKGWYSEDEDYQGIGGPRVKHHKTVKRHSLLDSVNTSALWAPCGQWGSGVSIPHYFRHTYPDITTPPKIFKKLPRHTYPSTNCFPTHLPQWNLIKPINIVIVEMVSCPAALLVICFRV